MPLSLNMRSGCCLTVHYIHNLICVNVHVIESLQDNIREEDLLFKGVCQSSLVHFFIIFMGHDDSDRERDISYK